MLRLPPSRIELKYEDVKEYELAKRSWESAIPCNQRNHGNINVETDFLLRRSERRQNKIKERIGLKFDESF